MKRFAPLEDIDSVVAILSRISFLGGISDEQRAKIFRHFELARFKQGEYVLRKGEDPSCLFVIKSGSVDLLIEEEGRSVRKRTFHVGDCFGEAAMLSMINDTATFLAAEDSELLVFARRSLNVLHQENLELFSLLILNMARELARKLQYTDHMLVELGRAGADASTIAGVTYGRETLPPTGDSRLGNGPTNGRRD